MELPQYPITLIDYNIIVPAPGVIIFDEEMNADHLCVKDGDTFEVSIKNGRIVFIGKTRKKTD